MINRLRIERNNSDHSGIYAYMQRELAYHSNKIEGSTLTKEQTASLFDTGTFLASETFYRAKDIEEMNGHFLMFNTMIDTLDECLSVELIKKFHYDLKSGVFEDRANGYAIGDFKKRPNMIGVYTTVSPKMVPQKMNELLMWYHNQSVIDLSVLTKFHAEYESIHPFQDGNGRTGRLILFRECLKANLIPFIIEDENRMQYLNGLKKYRESKTIELLQNLFIHEQKQYEKKMAYFLCEDADVDISDMDLF